MNRPFKLQTNFVTAFDFKDIRKKCARYDILCKYQSGFRTKHLTDLCLSYLRDKMLKDFDNSLLTGMILTDLRKAFDIIDHNNILLEKSKAISFCDDTVNQFHSYLTD